MSLDIDSIRSLLLGGTVALPAPHPAAGMLTRYPPKDAIQEGAIPVVMIENRIEPLTRIVRIVRLDDIRAILEPPDCEHRGIYEGEWKYLAGTDRQCIPKMGIVFVPEHAPVLTRVEFSGTAAESAEYRAPTMRSNYDCDRERGCDRKLDCDR